jgi:hypothetical protein
MTTLVVHNYVRPPRRRARARDATTHGSAAYEAAYQAHNAAFREFDKIRRAYTARNSEISDEEFLAAKQKYDEATKKFDAAFAAEERRGSGDSRARRRARDASWGDRWYVKFSATEEQEQRIASTLSRIGGRKSGYDLKRGGVNEYVYELQEAGLAVRSLRSAIQAAGGKILAEADYM